MNIFICLLTQADAKIRRTKKIYTYRIHPHLIFSVFNEMFK